jgi:hypothetical protein
MEEETGDDYVPREALALLSEERLILRETGRAVTPFGGVTVFVAYLRKVDFVEKLRQCMPICCDRRIRSSQRHAEVGFRHRHLIPMATLQPISLRI